MSVLLSHVHGDRLVDRHQASPQAGTGAKPDASVSDTPDSGTVKVTVAKNAKLLVGGEMGSFFTKKVANAGGDASQVQLVRFGGERAVNGVKVYSVPAVHSNGRSEEHTSELQSLMRISYAVFCLKKKKKNR